MSSNESHIKRLMVKYAHGEELTAEEMQTLMEWWRQSPQHGELAEEFGDEDWVQTMVEKLEQAPKELWVEMSRRLDEMDAPPLEADQVTEGPEMRGRVVSKRVWIAVGMAAAAMLITVVSIYLLWRRPALKPEVAGAAPASVLVSDENVVCTTSDGRKIDVDGIPVGKVVDTAGSRILRKVDTNALAYDPAPEQPVNIWNCLVVGKKRSRYHLRMPDGSAVWLAGGSSLQYPLNNRGLNHPATLSGRGYFDVIKDTARPWVIYMPGGGRIEVHGTIFVAEGGKGQRMRVALYRGKLNVFKGSQGKELHPGEEAVDRQDKLVVEKMKDPAAAMAWVTPALYFHFNNTTLESAVQQVAAWYGYAVHNAGGIKGTPITDDVWRPSTPDVVVQAIGQLETNYASLYIRDRTIVIAQDRSAPK